VKAPIIDRARERLPRQAGARRSQAGRSWERLAPAWREYHPRCHPEKPPTYFFLAIV